MIDNISRGRLVAEDPAVSIIIPNYNTARYISETLESVFAQTYKSYEIVVVNDASPDTVEFRETIKPYLDRIVLFENKTNIGTSATRNLAVSIARGKMICFLDADDIWRPSFLQDLTQFLDKHNYDLVFADCETFTTGGEPVDRSDLNPEQGEITRANLIDGKCHILPTGAVITKVAFLAVDGFDSKVTRTEDFDLWMRMLFNGSRFGYLRKVLFKFRISPGSGSGDAVVRIQRSILCWRTLQEKLEFTPQEHEKIEYHVNDLKAGALRSQARDAIYRENWKEAKTSLREALAIAKEIDLPLAHRVKIKMVILLLGISPSLVRSIYSKARPDEIEYLPSNV